jgi:hypothetical protein
LVSKQQEIVAIVVYGTLAARSEIEWRTIEIKIFEIKDRADLVLVLITKVHW